METVICKWEYLEIIFDKELYPTIRDIYGWTVNKTQQGNYYLRCCKPGYKNKMLARVLLNAPAHYQVDHINGNTLDNRLCNLRLASVQHNQANKQKATKNNLPKGVIKVGKRYRASIRHNYVTIHIGVYDTPEQAGLAYAKKAEEFYGEFAVHRRMHNGSEG